MEKETLFLVGGSGFIGRNLVRFLYPHYLITVFDKYIDETFFRNYPTVTCYEMDLVREEIPKDIFTPHYIINLASIVTAERDLSLFDDLVASNLKILLNLYGRYKEDKALKLLIQFGSSEEYGSGHSPFMETQREQPNSPYALVKQLTTNTALMLYRNYSFPAMVVRPGNLFGPGQNGNKFIPYVLECLRHDKVLNVTPCEQKRDFIYVDDFARAIHALLVHCDEVKGEIVNVSSGKSISLKEIIEDVKTSLQSKSQIYYGALPYRENEAMDLVCDISKLCEIMGEKPDMDIRKRIKEYIKL